MAMMQPRGGVGSRGAAHRKRVVSRDGVQQVYQDFNPMSEWEQTDDSLILHLYAPGFMKEQINVSTEGQNKIAVHGERSLSGNKWSHFHNEFQVPGEMNSLQVAYREGTLTITIPKGENPKPTNPDAHQTLGLCSEETMDDAKRNESCEKDDNKSREKYRIEETLEEEEVSNKTNLDEDRTLNTLKKKMATKEIAEFSKERRLMVNITGVVIVIITLTAYATYKFAIQKAM